MNNDVTPQNEYIADNILETLINAYLNNTRRTTPEPVHTPAPPPPNTNSNGLYYAIVLALRDVISGYNANTRLILDIIRCLRQDISSTEGARATNTHQAPIGSQNRFSARNVATGLPNGTAQRPVRLFNVDMLSTMYNTPLNMQDVVVRPTEQQLDMALETITYVQNEVTPARCPITLEDFVPGNIITRIKPCGHMFNTQSIRDWFSSRVRCPVCRYDIREYLEANRVDISANSPDVSGVDTDQTLDGLTSNISSIIANYFANNIDLSLNQVFRFDIPIITTTTYEDSNTETVSEEDEPTE